MGKESAKLGKVGENKAVDYLRSRGYEVLTRNYRCRYGEIDIIALKQDVLCFVEVKTRVSAEYGYPYEAVNERKKGHIMRCAYVYMDERRRQGDSIKYDRIRIEVIELFYRSGRFYVRHIKDC